jgi:hypothetical protein
MGGARAGASCPPSAQEEIHERSKPDEIEQGREDQASAQAAYSQGLAPSWVEMEKL